VSWKSRVAGLPLLMMTWCAE